MLLPARRLHDGCDRRASGPAQQTDHFNLLGIGSRVGLMCLFGLGRLWLALRGGCGLRFLGALGLGHFRTPSIETAPCAVTTDAPRRPTALAGKGAQNREAIRS